MQAKGRLQCWNADGQELGGSCREGCAGKGQAATLEQQRLPARKSSTPAVVPGAAPALAKAGVGGFPITLCQQICLHLQGGARKLSSP